MSTFSESKIAERRDLSERDVEKFIQVFHKKMRMRPKKIMIGGVERECYMSSQTSASNWMQVKAPFFADKTLREITLIGSHDSGAYMLQNNLLTGDDFLKELYALAEKLGLPAYEIAAAWSMTQSQNAYDQMAQGTRYFDLRCAYADGLWVAYHGLAGPPIEDICLDMKRFLDAHQGEICLIEASHIMDEGQDRQTLVDIFLNTFGDLLYPSQPDTFPTYSEMIEKNQRLIIFQDGDVSAWPQIWPTEQRIVNTWANTDSEPEMAAYNDTQVDTFMMGGSGAPPESLYKISWTLTPDVNTVLRSFLPFTPKSLLDLADGANKDIDEWSQAKINEQKQIGNIFIYDNTATVDGGALVDILYPQE